METHLSTLDVCRALGLTEPALRHALRRPGAPRPALHPTVRVFLWTQADVDRLAAFLKKEEADNHACGGLGFESR